MASEAGRLSCQGLVIERAGTTVVRGVSLVAEPGQVTVILGANGAGKTSLLEGLSGLIPAASGSVRLGGQDLTKASAAKRARAGLCHVQQGRQVFARLTVEENLLVAAPRAQIGRALEIFPELVRLRGRRAGLLSGGEQQMLVIARAILTQPRVVLFDEMSLGLAPAVVRRLLARVKAIADDGVAVVLVEQFARLALALGHRAYIMSKGTVVFEGDCRRLIDDSSELHSAYFRT